LFPEETTKVTPKVTTQKKKRKEKKKEKESFPPHPLIKKKK
jgi:hypothetical protein